MVESTGGMTVRDEIQNQRLSRQGRETVRDGRQNQWLSRQRRETDRGRKQNQPPKRKRKTESGIGEKVESTVEAKSEISSWSSYRRDNFSERQKQTVEAKR